jgi:hypothetical protein
VTSLSVLIEGNYVDAYLYGGLLLVWDDKGRLLIVNTETLADAVVESHSVSRSIARAAFVDNKLLDKPGALTRARKVAMPKIRNGDGAVMHLRAHEMHPSYFSVADDAHVLDLMATYNSLFISTDDSLLSVPFGPFEVGDVVKRFPHRCLSTSQRWGAVSASCAERGAWVLLEEVGEAKGSARKTEQIDEKVSIRHAWLGSTLLSFDESNSIDLFKAVVPTRKGERRRMRGFISPDEFEDPEYLWWSSPEWDPIGIEHTDFVTTFTGLLVAAGDGIVRATRVSLWTGAPEPVGEPLSITESDDRVLSVVDTVGGFVLETDEKLSYLSIEDEETLLARETISLRSYQRSKRYRRMVTATVDGGLLVTALLGDHLLPQDERWAYPAW